MALRAHPKYTSNLTLSMSNEPSSGGAHAPGWPHPGGVPEVRIQLASLGGESSLLAGADSEPAMLEGRRWSRYDRLAPSLLVESTQNIDNVCSCGVSLSSRWPRGDEFRDGLVSSVSGHRLAFIIDAQI